MLIRERLGLRGVEVLQALRNGPSNSPLHRGLQNSLTGLLEQMRNMAMSGRKAEV